MHDIINKIDDGSGTLTFDIFCTIMQVHANINIIISLVAKSSFYLGKKSRS